MIPFYRGRAIPNGNLDGGVMMTEKTTERTPETQGEMEKIYFRFSANVV
ncbi:MAG: hypothetical protein PHE53_08225 [Thermoguttaceae bacterium]|nr:hypothetical protein [Thermoguttaceae bacterium]